MKLYCLNLARAKGRRAKITKEWIEGKGFNLEFFPAFDRRQVDEGSPLPFTYDEVATRGRIKRPLTSGEIACAISHTQLLIHALKNDHNEIIVLEDDMVPLPESTPSAVADAINICKTTFPSVNVLLMHEPTSEIEIFDQRENISLLRRAPYGYRFVWLNRKAMKILIQDLSRLLYPADWLWSLRFAPMKSVALLNSPFCTHPEAQTYIGNHFRQDQRQYIP